MNSLRSRAVQYSKNHETTSTEHSLRPSHNEDLQKFHTMKSQNQTQDEEIGTLPSSEAAKSKPSKTKTGNKRTIKAIFIWSIFVLVLIVCITVPLVMKKSRKTDRESIGSNAVNNQNESNENDVQSNENKEYGGIKSLDEDGVEEEEEVEEEIEEKVEDEPNLLFTEDTKSLLFQNAKLSVSLPEFNSEILSGYLTCQDLHTDIEQALNDYANGLIEQDFTDFIEMPIMAFDMSEGAPVAMAAESDVTSNGATANKGADTATIEEDSFGTNNQQEGVEEADIIKSDGTFVYTVYGTNIVVLNTTGEEVFRLDVAPRKTDPYYGYDNEISPPVLPKKEVETVSISEPVVKESEQNPNTDNNNRRSLSALYFPGESIRGLLLYENRLIAILSGYHQNYDAILSTSTTQIISMERNLQNGNLTIIEQTKLNGDYQAGRLIENNAHIVTSDYMSHWKFSQKISRYQREYQDLTDEEYMLKAFEKAKEEIPKHATRLMRELIKSHAEEEEEEDGSEKEDLDLDLELDWTLIDSDACQHIARLSNYQNGKLPDENLAGLNGVLNGFVRVISFDIMETFETTSHLSAAFTPSGYADVYASQDVLVLGGRGWKPFRPLDDSLSPSVFSEDVTYLTAFSLEGASAIPMATGVVPGYTLNQFSMDYYNGYLRIATTTNEIRDWNRDTWTSTLLQNSTNQIYTCEIKNQQIDIVGRLEGLGITERVFAVRFLQDRAFMVTFRQTDPFYAIDMSDPFNPQMTGELKIPGFSNYLHPVGNDYILAVGQDADEETGFSQGLQIALFDVSDMMDPQQIAKYIVEGWSYSESQHDHYAFRYLPLAQKLILPISERDFDGFHVFDINLPSSTVASFENNQKIEDASIEFDFQISHFNTKDEFKCYGRHYLTPRSLVFQGDVMTLKGHTVLTHDLNTGAILNKLEMDSGLKKNKMMCYGWYW